MIKQINKKGINIFHLDNEKELTDCPSEDVEQIQFTVDLGYKHPELSGLYMHPVNEGLIPIQYRVKQKRKGMLKGASDIIMLQPCGGFHYLIIELKRQNIRKSTPVSEEQKVFINNVSKAGGFACVAYGAKAAMHVVDEYLNKSLTFVN